MVLLKLEAMRSGRPSEEITREAVRAYLQDRPGKLPPGPAPVIPEVDHLLETRIGAAGRMAFYQGLSGGFYFVADLPKEEYAPVEERNRQFADLSLGFVGAAIVAISEALDLPRIATADRRDFGPLADAFALKLLP